MHVRITQGSGAASLKESPLSGLNTLVACKGPFLEALLFFLRFYSALT